MLSFQNVLMSRIYGLNVNFWGSDRPFSGATEGFHIPTRGRKDLFLSIPSVPVTVRLVENGHLSVWEVVSHCASFKFPSLVFYFEGSRPTHYNVWGAGGAGGEEGLSQYWSRSHLVLENQCRPQCMQILELSPCPGEFFNSAPKNLVRKGIILFDAERKNGVWEVPQFKQLCKVRITNRLCLFGNPSKHCSCV